MSKLAEMQRRVAEAAVARARVDRAIQVLTEKRPKTDVMSRAEAIAILHQAGWASEMIAEAIEGG